MVESLPVLRPTPRHRGQWRAYLVHALRIVLLGTILLLIHRQHQRVISAQRAAGLDSIPLEVIQSLFPQATGLGEPDLRGGKNVLQGEQVIGSVLQTFPEAEAFTGFSGPTNLLIGLDRSDRIAGIRILSTRDTQEHVDLIRKDPRFLSTWNGKELSELSTAGIDAVSGATLTSLALLQGIQSRLGRVAKSLKFPDEYTLDQARRLFPKATDLQQEEQTPELWRVSDETGQLLGWLLSNSPAADGLSGYQGPTQAFLGLTLDHKILGLVVAESYDNEPYVGYVREDGWFAKLFDGKSLEDLAQLEFEMSGIEGVSGATMTSQAIAQGLLLAARSIEEQRRHNAEQAQNTVRLHWKTLTTLILIGTGLLMAFTPLRGSVVFRRVYQVCLILVMGLINGDLLSMAMFIGWAQSGIPWQNALGLVCLTAAALALPIFGRVNVYCDHICPHGAAQQLLPRRWKLKNHPRWMSAVLRLVRPVLLVIIVLVPLLNWSFSLVQLEPFDAYIWNAAGIATISIAIGGLLFSLFVPMGYCQHGCPTGAVLGYLRRHRRSGAIHAGDYLALTLLGIAVAISWM